MTNTTLPTNKSRKVELEGRGPLSLRPGDYKVSGGEAAIYQKGATIIKLYSDKDKMRRDNMAEKIRQLAKLKHESIVAPQGVVREGGDPVGFYMPVASGFALPQFFTNDFRAREHFTDSHAKVLVAHMHDTVQFAHGSGWLLVNPNELNWVVDLKHKKAPFPSVLDVDSWAQGMWPAHAIMPSIRDWHTQGFTALSDWFSWAVVTFQIWTGIHPYKGTLPGFDRFDFEARMKASRSVFAPGVRLNRAVRDFSVIPAPLLSWYEATFEHQERSIPPSPFETGGRLANAAKVMRVVVTGLGSLVYEKLFSTNSAPIIRVFPMGLALASDGTLYDLVGKRSIATLPTYDAEVVSVEDGYLAGWMEDTHVRFAFINKAGGEVVPLELPVHAFGISRSGNRLFAVTAHALVEVVAMHFNKPVLAQGSSWGILGNSTQFFGGVGVMDALGAKFLVLPFGEKACATVRTPELDGRTIVAAKAGVRFVLLVTLDRDGKYKRVEFVFDRAYGTYTVRENDADGPELNAAILPKGVVARIEEDGELLISVPSTGVLNKVADKDIATDMILARLDDRVLFLRNGEVWSLRMR